MNPDNKNIEYAREDSNSAFILIYNTYIDELFSYGSGLGFNKHILKDAIQDVFFRLYLHRTSLRDIKNIKFYLFRSLKNRLLDICKTSMPTSDIADNELGYVLHLKINDELIDEEDQLIIQNKVKALLDLLTSRQREAIYLRFIQEMEYEEIGQLLKMTPQATRKLVFRAMERMRKQNLPLLLLLITLAEAPSSYMDHNSNTQMWSNNYTNMTPILPDFLYV